MAHYFDHFPGTSLEINTEKYLYFGGTAYLGLQADPTFQKIFIRNIKKYGTAYGASRKSNVRLSIYDKTERFLAAWTGSETAVTLSSGYLAGQLAANCYNTAGYKLFYAPNCHTALFQAIERGKQPKPYVTYTSLGIALRQHLELNNGQVPVVLLDAIDFSGNNYPDFEGIKSLPLEQAVLLADDSHGIGIVGPDGGGVFQILEKLNPRELVVCCSLGKALGIQAGAIFCSEQRYKHLTSTAFYSGASPAAPAYLATLLQGWKLVEERRLQLHKNIDQFNAGIKNIPKISRIDNYPAFSYSDPELSSFLFKNKIIVTDFAYPNDTEILSSRIVLNARHSREEIDNLINILQDYFVKN